MSILLFYFLTGFISALIAFFISWYRGEDLYLDDIILGGFLFLMMGFISPFILLWCTFLNFINKNKDKILIRGRKNQKILDSARKTANLNS